MDVEQLRQDVADGTVKLDRLAERIASQQKRIQQLQEEVERLKEQIEKNPTARLDEAYSERAEAERQAKVLKLHTPRFTASDASETECFQ